MTPSLRSAVAVLLVGALSAAGCGSDAESLRTEEAGQEQAVTSFSLPFGLEHVEGTEPIARPLAFEHVAQLYDGRPISARALRVAYRVTADDPALVLRRWADQILPLGLGDVRIGGSGSQHHGPWAEARTHTTWDPAGPGPGHARVELWATPHEPILLVSVDRHIGEEEVASSVVDAADLPPEPEPRVDADPPGPRAELFREQGTAVHVPEGARALMPMIPTPGGTGGSTSLLTAADEVAVIRRMLDEAGASSEHDEQEGPEVEVQDGTTVTTASFVIPAGGWAFSVVAVRGLDDAEALLWVQSWAD